MKTQGLFSPKTQGWRHFFIVTMTSSGKILVKNSRIFFKNSIFRHFEAQSMPHKCPKKSPALGWQVFSNDAGLSFVHLTRFLTLSNNRKNWVFPLLELGFLILSWVLTILELSFPIFGTGFFEIPGSGFLIIILEFHTQKSLHMPCHKENTGCLRFWKIWISEFLDF